MQLWELDEVGADLVEEGEHQPVRERQAHLDLATGLEPGTRSITQVFFMEFQVLRFVRPGTVGVFTIIVRF